MTLHTTHGLGHKRILTDPAVVDATFAHLLDPDLRNAQPDILEPRCPSALSG